jgi:hypothetical protein
MCDEKLLEPLVVTDRLGGPHFVQAFAVGTPSALAKLE